MKVLVDTDCLIVSSSTKKAPLVSGAFLTKVKETILNKKYDLSISFIGREKMKGLNQKTRNINKVTDILSFPIDSMGGEIYICMESVITKSKLFETTPKKYLEYLFVHGMTHLLGHDHGKKMDQLEMKFTKKLNIYHP